MVAITSEELLQQQLADISEQQAAKSKPIELPKAIGISYNAELQRMVRRIKKDIDQSIKPQVKDLEFEYTADSWADVIEVSLAALRQRWSSEIFNRFAERMASKFVQAVNVQNQQQFQNQYKSFGINIYAGNQAVSDYLDATVKDNVRLIKSIPDQYLTQVEAIVLGNMRAGMRPSAINKQLQDQFGVTERRARVISRDQVSKASNGLAKKRMESSGFKYFQWIDSKDSRVRSRHKHIANKVTKYGKGIYSFSDLPLNDKGIPIAPSDDIQCRCVMRPVLPSETDNNKKKGLTSPGVDK
ncbi:head morphogenesis domain protein [Vibrio phage 1.263.B._10N.286.51.B1]|nr:head morphogenesis domain protein [Vibrio phage 1.263.A._10N.286.51.B1]AUR99248.1 head morphogenesis domain protein [Vibrio phage 1.263.B._10N.286.51.B1]